MNDDADDGVDADDYDPDEYSWLSLLDPIKRGDLPAIQRFLAEKPEGLYAACPNMHDPFIVAAQQPDPEAPRLLLEHWVVHPTPGEPPPNERGSSLFNVACAHGALETVRYLLDEQPALVELHPRIAHGYTPILEAAKPFVSYAGDEMSEMIAERDGRGRFDAQAARERVHRSEALVSLLLSRGACARDSMDYTEWDANPAIVDRERDRDTVLSLAIARAGPALLRRLIDDGADAFATTNDRSHDIFGSLFQNTGMSRKLTLLHLAAFYGNYPGVQVLMEHYAQRGLDMADAVACQDQFGRLPMHYAAAGWPGAIGAIGATGATWHGLDSNSTNADTGANTADVDTNTMAFLRILTDSGNPRLTNAVDQYGETPLHYAVSPNLITGRAAVAVAHLLCTYLHASGRLHGCAGETPLHRLWRYGAHHMPSGINTRLAALLVDLDEGLAADVNAVDDAGNTPIHLAARCLTDLSAARFLLGRGANIRTQNKRGPDTAS